MNNQQQRALRAEVDLLREDRDLWKEEALTLRTEMDTLRSRTLGLIKSVMGHYEETDDE